MKAITLFAILFAACLTANAQVKSVYTDLDDRKCKTLELTDDEGGSYKGECKGVGGYKLWVIEGDLRQNIIIVDPSKKEHNLRFWEFFGGFSAVDAKAEWRTRDGKPFALIVRLNVSEDPVNSSKTTSYLLVAKLTPLRKCITNVIRPSKTQNVEARKAADASSLAPCRQVNID